MRGKGKDIVQMAEKHQRILEAGFRLFSRRGIDLVTMPDIAETSGVGRTTLYRYFSTKTELVIAIATWKWKNYIDAYQAATPEEQLRGMTAAGQLRWYMDSFIDVYRNYRDILRFNYYFNSYIRSEAVAPGLMKPYMQVVNDVEAGFRVLYEIGRKDGTIRTDISETAMFSSTFHIMLAAVTRYAIGLLYVPEEEADPEGELILLENALLREFVT